MAKQYGWTFDKSGKRVQVSAPVHANGKKARKRRKVLTGAIPDSVGFSGFKS